MTGIGSERDAAEHYPKQFAGHAVAIANIPLLHMGAMSVSRALCLREFECINF